jgi:hypothetical protein
MSIILGIVLIACILRGIQEHKAKEAMIEMNKKMKK